MKELLRKVLLACICVLAICSSVIVYAEDHEDTYNLLLIGVDRLDDTWNGNSDVMLLLTVNETKETVYMTSFLRDLYAEIPGYGVQKLNAACAIGGADLCVETIKSNYGVQIDNYAMVDFFQMRDIVDIIGGVDIDITWDEAEVANRYITQMCNAKNEDPQPYYITSEGLLHLNGYQAVGYARNRYTGNTYDFGRTQRQRNVLLAIFSQAMEQNLADITALIYQILPYMKHDISEIKMIRLLAKITTWKNYHLEQQHIPYTGEYYSQNEILTPYDMNDTIQRLQATLY